jgi:hypothetical protein
MTLLVRHLQRSQHRQLGLSVLVGSQARRAGEVRTPPGPSDEQIAHADQVIKGTPGDQGGLPHSHRQSEHYTGECDRKESNMHTSTYVCLAVLTAAQSGYFWAPATAIAVIETGYGGGHEKAWNQGAPPTTT